MNLLKSSKQIWLLSLFVLALMGCETEKKFVDISDVNVNLEVQRFEQDLFSIQPNDIPSGLEALSDEYGAFLPLYIEEVMNFGLMQDTSKQYLNAVNDFLTNPYILGLIDTVNDRFPDLSDQNNALEEALKYFRYHFPKRGVPKIVTYISEFGPAAFNFDTTLIGVGLDMYLGKDYVYYKSFFPQYVIDDLSKDQLVPNVMRVVYDMHFEDQGRQKLDLIYEMIEEGKRLYFLECMMPHTDEAILIKYTTEQLTWCYESEASIWQYLVDQDLMFTKDHFEYRNLIGEAPTTNGMPLESPGEVGKWVGWQIVKAYMQKTGDEIQLQELLETDSRTILTISKYNPVGA